MVDILELLLEKMVDFLELLPRKMVDFLELLQTSEGVRFQMRSCPHHVVIVTVGMDL